MEEYRIYDNEDEQFTYSTFYSFESAENWVMRTKEGYARYDIYEKIS